MKVYVFSAGKKSNQEYGRERYESELLDLAKRMLDNIGGSFLDGVSSVLCRLNGQYLVLSTGLLGQSVEKDSRGRPFRVNIAWVLNSESQANAIYRASLADLPRRVELFEDNQPGKGDKFADRVIGSVSWDSRTELGYEYEEESLIAWAREADVKVYDGSLRKGADVLTPDSLRTLEKDVQNSSLPLVPETLAVAVVHDFVDRDAFERNVYRGLVQGFNKKREAPKMPGESQWSRSTFQLSLLVSVLAASCLGIIYLATRDRTAPAVEQITANGQTISLTNPKVTIGTTNEQSTEIRIRWNEAIKTLTRPEILKPEFVSIETADAANVSDDEVVLSVKLAEVSGENWNGELTLPGVKDLSGNESPPVRISLEKRDRKASGDER